MEVFLKLLHQLRGKGRKILLAQTDNQKVTGDDVVDLAVSVPQRTIQVFPMIFPSSCITNATGSLKG